VVSKNAFGANGFGGVTVPAVHDSPPKLGSSNLITPTKCDASCVVNVAVATGTAATTPPTTLTAQASAQVCFGTQPQPAGGLPSPWLTQDVGPVQAQGTAAYAASTFTIEGSGSDIGGSKDEFRYVYQPADGDCTIVAKVLSVEKTDNNAKAGVLIRETLATDSRHAAVLVTPSNGIQFKTRSTTGGSTSTKTKNGLTAPYWVKFVRSGSTFTGYYSPDGATWTSMGSVTISMGQSVYIGLGVNSHKDGTLCTGTLDNVTATP